MTCPHTEVMYNTTVATAADQISHCIALWIFSSEHNTPRVISHSRKAGRLEVEGLSELQRQELRAINGVVLVRDCVYEQYRAFSP